MEIKKNVKVPAHLESRVVGLKCDICGAEVHSPNATASYIPDWSKELYEIDHITIEREVGWHYPEDCSTQTVGVDLCPKCWTLKFIPWLESQGTKLSERDT